MKRLIASVLPLALCLALLCGALLPLSAAADAYTHAVDGINTNRGTNQLILYTEGDTTGTNEWGYEVCVGANGVILSVGGNNSVIPSGGYVVSGHGDSRGWLQNHTRKGMYAFYDPYTKTIRFSAEPIEPTYSFTMTYSGSNVYRGTDMLVLFTRAWGTVTNTNQWGYEVRVDKSGRVVGIGGNNQAIPEGGFVLSGHGASIDPLKKLSIGEKIEVVDGTTLRITYDGLCALIGIESVIEELSAQIPNRKAAGVMGDFDRAAELLAEAKAVLAATDRSDSMACFTAEQEIDRLAYLIRQSLTESVAGEYRGVWLRPTEKTAEAVANRVQKLCDGGINMIAIEIFYANDVVYPTPENLPIQQMSSFNGFDVLQCYIDECHKRQMELHAWCPNVYAGNNPSTGIPGKHPDWLMKNDLGKTVIPTEYGDMYFINPFNKDAVNGLLEQYRYLFTHYDLDAFQLDYIRYPGQGSGVDWGYNEDALNAFQKKYGVRPEYNVSASYWNSWCQFRADAVTDFVRQIRDLAHEVRPDMLLTADVFADIDDAPYSVYQDYDRWMREGLVDMIHPMAYTSDNADFERIVARIVNKGYKVPVAPGLGIYVTGYSPALAMDQTMIARKYGCVGVVHFQAVQYLTQTMTDRMTASVYASGSFVPYKDSFRACDNALNVLIRRAATALTNNGIVSAKDCETLQAAADKTRLSLTAPDPSASEIRKAVSGLQNKTASAILSQDVARLEKLMTFLRPGEEHLEPTERGKTVADFAKSQGADEIRLCNGFPANASDLIGTGMYATKDGVRHAAVVLGDLNGDGEISALDYLICKRHVLRTSLLTGPFLEAARISGNDDISAVDYLLIKKHVLNLVDIPAA